MRSNDLRGAITDQMKLRAAEFRLHPDAIHWFVGKAKDIQIKHYQGLAGEGLAAMQEQLFRE